MSAINLGHKLELAKEALINYRLEYLS